MALTGTVTVLFTDLVGSTALMTELGNDRFQKLLTEHDTLVDAAIAAHAGEHVKHTGDGVMAVFAGAADGLGAAVTIQQAVERRNRRAKVPFIVRVGLSVGDITEKDGDYFGTPAIEAARLCAIAEGGQILAADLVRALAGSRGDHQFVSLGDLELKGLLPLATVEVGWQRASGDTRLPLPASIAREDRVSLVGREAELAVLLDAWTATRAGTRQFVLVSGEPGIGKTRICTELARRAHADGGIVLLGRCDEALGAPLSPIVDALESLLEATPDDELRRWAGGGAPELARLMPELGSRLGSPPEAMPTDPDTERFRLFAAIVRVLEHAAANSPVLLVLDDLHWADRATALLLRHLARVDRSGALLVLGTAREAELDPAGPLADIAVERVRLVGLDETDTNTFITALGGAELASIHAQTDGNPFYVREIVAHILETGDQGVPAGVRELLTRRLARLSDLTQRTLGAAAVIGHEFDLDLLAAVVSDDPDVVLDRLDEAGATGLLDEIDGRVGRFAFEHALVRAAIVDGLGMTRRLRLHQRVGDALVAAGSGDVTALAHHFIEAAPIGTAAQAVSYARAAANDALERFAAEAALAVLERALAVVNLADDPSRLLRCDLLAELSMTAALCGGSDVATGYAEEAAGLARSAGSLPQLVSVTRAYGYVADIGTGSSMWAEICAEALVLCGPESNVERALLLAYQSLERSGRGTEDSALIAGQALEVARPTEDPRAIAAALVAHAFSLLPRARPREVIAAADEAEEYLAKLPRLQRFAPGGPRHVTPFLLLGDRAAFEARVAELKARLGDAGLSLEGDFLLGAQGMLALLDGRLAEADRLARALPREGTIRLVGMAQLAAVRRERGDLERLAANYEPMLAALPQLPSIRAGYAEVLAELGRSDDALRELDSLAGNAFAAIRWDTGRPLALRDLAETIARLDHGEHAATLHPLLVPHDGLTLVAWGTSSCEGAAARGLGQLETVLGRYDEAEAHYEAAIELEERILGRVCLPRTKYWYARMLLARGAAGDAARAATLLDFVIAETGELGMTAIEAQAREVR